ncbi:hypothetical protein VOLCADRAFT_118601 [Volvox carteri f. nagariensis]|uniref:DUF7781 domain-containing protein n=1 Tax=Volvox carteri f. nagariensis TaxID=3068 RepID=D8U619_VOLCA|nr:uncharacterized protein VOLCADRAFT_118601 [Volvox carteri f. nagariensis]EFJ44862.1 hypothetical protein VOLCADRAFT_118601 [Volvox carteri f. nagariensis]|eukprot:XP_002954145.1 hypothetical protein VOLCADRAFT_118601 [Volvox carteri f. nagariensis]
MSGEEEEAASQGLPSVIDEILDQYRFNWEPEYRLKFKKELASYTLSLAVSKPFKASTRVRMMVKPEQVDAGWRPGRFIQKALVMPQQRFAAVYSRKLALSFLRLQFVVGYFWDTRRPTLDYRFSTKWNEGLRFKRKEFIQPTRNLLIRTCWALDMQLPEAEGHLGGGQGSRQVPVEVEYGSLDISVTQVDFVCDFDGFKKNWKKSDQPRSLFAAAQPLEAAAAAAAAAGCACSCSSGSGGSGGCGGSMCACGAAGSAGAAGPVGHTRIAWPWQHQHHHQHSKVPDGSKTESGGRGRGTELESLSPPSPSSLLRMMMVVLTVMVVVMHCTSPPRVVSS